MTWETKKVMGVKPKKRGYHSCVLNDSRLFCFGGFDGVEVFNDFWGLELSSRAYLPQITNFEVGAQAL